MSLSDRFRRVMGLPESVDPASARSAALEAAIAAGDANAARAAALAYVQAQAFGDALAALAMLEERLPAQRAEWLRWQGQLLYINLSFHAPDPATRLECLTRALDCYFEAAALGDLSQSFNVLEICDALADEPALSAEQKREIARRYRALFLTSDLPAPGAR